jgi:hypothetical protein
MKKTLKNITTNLAQPLKTATKAEIRTFCQQASREISPSKDQLDAAGLFSFFTADIIKQETLFTR